MAPVAAFKYMKINLFLAFSFFCYFLVQSLPDVSLWESLIWEVKLSKANWILALFGLENPSKILESNRSPSPAKVTTVPHPQVPHPHGSKSLQHGDTPLPWPAVPGWTALVGNEFSLISSMAPVWTGFCGSVLGISLYFIARGTDSCFASTILSSLDLSAPQQSCPMKGWFQKALSRGSWSFSGSSKPGTSERNSVSIPLRKGALMAKAVLGIACVLQGIPSNCPAEMETGSGFMAWFFCQVTGGARGPRPRAADPNSCSSFCSSCLVFCLLFFASGSFRVKHPHRI